MKKRRVMGFGTFDAVHPGHLFYLKELRKLGDELFIVIARDRNVEKIKSKAPHFSEEVRKQHVEETGLADKVILGNEDDYYQVLRDYQPDILGFGYDQRADERKIRAQFPQVEIVRIEAYEPEKYKSSIVKAEQNRI